MEAATYNQEGKKVGTIKLSDRVFNAPWRPDLVHQVVLAMEANARTPVAHTKDRGEVRGGGKKPWRQKGTGRARHGSTRSPIWRTGGVTFGPRNERVYAQKINRKMRAGALFSVLSKKYKDGEVLFVDRLSMPTPKTKEAKSVLEKLAGLQGFAGIVGKRRNAALIALGTRDEATVKSFRNFSNIGLDETRALHPGELLRYKYVIITEPETSIAMLEGRGIRTTNAA